MSSQQKIHSARQAIIDARRVVVKVGSGILVDQDHRLDEERISVSGNFNLTDRIVISQNGA